MLEARKASVWKNRYDVTSNGRLITTWVRSSWKYGGVFDLDRRRYEVRANMWGSKYSMVREDGAPATSSRA